MARGIGTPMNAQRMGGGFSSLLWRMAQKLPPNERVKPKEHKRGGAPKKGDLSDEQVAECRRAFEAGEIKCRELAARHGTTYDRMYKILAYQTRSARTDGSDYVKGRGR
jgi:hypothetical protein